MTTEQSRYLASRRAKRRPAMGSWRPLSTCLGMAAFLMTSASGASSLEPHKSSSIRAAAWRRLRQEHMLATQRSGWYHELFWHATCCAVILH